MLNFKNTFASNRVSFRLLLLTLCLLFSGASFAKNSVSLITPQIINGSLVDESDPIAKSTVLLVGKIARASFTCTGVLIGPDVIVTAGHCLGAPGWAQLEAHFKTSKENKGPVIPVIKQLRPWATQASDRISDQDDIAVLKLKTVAPSTHQVVAMLEDVNQLKNDIVLTQAGFGKNTIRDSRFGKNGTGTLRKIDQKIINAQFGQREFLMSIQNGGACKGDSGGPAFLKIDGVLYLAGVTSRMSKNNQVIENGKVEYYCTKDMIYTAIPQQLNWIKTNIEALN